MATFTVPGHPDRVLDAVELRRAADGTTHPIVTGETAYTVINILKRRYRWFGKNLAVAPPKTGRADVIEILRPDDNGHYDLASIRWVGGQAPAKAPAETTSVPEHTSSRRPATVGG